MTWREDFADQRDIASRAGEYEQDIDGEDLRLFAEALSYYVPHLDGRPGPRTGELLRCFA
jgi:hypothetical protein